MQLNNNNNNSSNIKIKKTKENQVLNFITVKYIFKDKIKFDDYFSFNIQNGLYFCNICNCFKGSKRKFCIERHLLNSHFANREYCNICNKYYVRINEHNSKKHNNNPHSVSHKHLNRFYQIIRSYAISTSSLPLFPED